MRHTLLSLGHGYSARALAQRLIPQGWTIIGTTRSEDKAEQFAKDGVVPRLWQKEDLPKDIRQASHVLISAGPDAEGDPVLRQYRDEFAKASQIKWLGYLSTTGVYGDHKGGWVDEDTPLIPSTQRGQYRKDAETAWQTLAKEADLPLHIFRLAGIYGPGRGPFAKVRNGTARRIIKQNQIFSRIHVDDIAYILAASMLRPRPGAVYNVCDDNAAPPEDVIAYAAELLGVPVPKAVAFEDAEMTPMARSFYAESKRVRNRLLLDELGIRLAYPDYKTGLRALLEQENGDRA